VSPPRTRKSLAPASTHWRNSARAVTRARS
jgi:hypothetical protein